MVLRPGPVVGRVLVRPHLEGGFIGANRSFQARGSGFALPQPRECGAEVGLRPGPEQPVIAVQLRQHREGGVISTNCVCQVRDPDCSGFPLSQTRECAAAVFLRHGPVARRVLARPHRVDRVKSTNCVFQVRDPDCSGFPLSQEPENVSEDVLCPGPVARRVLARPHREDGVKSTNCVFQVRDSDCSGSRLPQGLESHAFIEVQSGAFGGS